TGIRTFQLERIESELTGKEQQVLQLFAEVLLATRTVEGDRRERVDDAVRTGDSAEQRLDPQYADDHLGRNAVLRFRPAELRFVRRPELGAGGDAGLVQELRAIGRIGSHRRRPIGPLGANQPCDGGLVTRRAEHALELRGIEAVLRRHGRDERLDFLSVEIRRLRRMRTQEQRRKQDAPQCSCVQRPQTSNPHFFSVPPGSKQISDASAKPLLGLRTFIDRMYANINRSRAERSDDSHSVVRRQAVVGWCLADGQLVGRMHTSGFVSERSTLFGYCLRANRGYLQVQRRPTASVVSCGRMTRPDLHASPFSERACVVTIEFDCAMLFRLFRKPTDTRPRFEQDPCLAEALARRVEEIQFRPTKGFLKDRQQPKRTPEPPSWARK